MTLVLMSTVLVMHGGLLSDFAPRAGMLAVGAESAVSAEQPKLETMTLAQLEAERVRVEATMPSLWLPITCFAVGGGAFLVGAGFFLFVSLAVGGVLFAIAAPIIAAGIVLLLVNGPDRKAAGLRLREIRGMKLLLEQREQRLEMPPPPPPPPGVEREGHVPSLLLATF